MSRDGTGIGYDQAGAGPALIIVYGAMSTRSSGSKPELVTLLAPYFTVYSYDRRGRGDSGDTPPYAVDREIEDIEAVISEAGGTAFLYGHSSGGCLALEAARKLGGKVPKLAVYEAPCNDEPAAQQAWSQYLDRLGEALAAGRHGDAVALFMRSTGTPAGQVDGMRQAPFWPALEAIAPTLAYDHAGVIGKTIAVPAGRRSPAACSGPCLVRRAEPCIHASQRPGHQPGDPHGRTPHAGRAGTRRATRGSRSRLDRVSSQLSSYRPRKDHCRGRWPRPRVATNPGSGGARHVPGRAVNRGGQRSLPDKLVWRPVRDSSRPCPRWCCRSLAGMLRQGRFLSWAYGSA